MAQCRVWKYHQVTWQPKPSALAQISVFVLAWYLLVFDWRRMNKSHYSQKYRSCSNKNMICRQWQTFFFLKSRANLEHFGRTANFCSGVLPGMGPFFLYLIFVLRWIVLHTWEWWHPNIMASIRWLWSNVFFRRFILVLLNLIASRPLPTFRLEPILFSFLCRIL